MATGLNKWFLIGNKIVETTDARLAKALHQHLTNITRAFPSPTKTKKMTFDIFAKNFACLNQPNAPSANLLTAIQLARP